MAGVHSGGLPALLPYRGKVSCPKSHIWEVAAGELELMSV